MSTTANFYVPPPALAESAHVAGRAAYDALVQEAASDYQAYWAPEGPEPDQGDRQDQGIDGAPNGLSGISADTWRSTRYRAAVDPGAGAGFVQTSASPTWSTASKATVPLSVRIHPTSSARWSPTNSRNGAEWCDKRA